MLFEWDAGKAEANFRKHGVSFDLVSAAFRDPLLIEEIDETEDYGEERVIMTAMAHGQLLIIVYTMRHERYRIISARKATRDEQDYYYLENGA